MVERRIVKTICNMCQMGCGIDVHVEDGRIAKVSPMEGHVFKGLCPKAGTKAISEMVYSEQRLKTPLKKVNGQFKEISWDEAFNFISEKLDKVKKQYGAKALAYNTGNAFISTHTEKAAKRLCGLYGTPNFTSGASFCFYARVFAHSLTFDYRGVFATPSWRKSQCAIIWGGNPTESTPGIIPAINNVQKKGGKLIVIDPKIIPLAKQADIHAQVRPGSDCALALGLLHVMIEEELYDKDFVKDWTIGFDKLAAHVKNYCPEKVASITWVSAEKIRAIARIYARSKPATILQGVALDHFTNGVQASRAVAILMAVTGNVDLPGGNTWARGGVRFTLKLPEGSSKEEGIGIEYPIFNRFTHERSAMCIPDAILNGRPYPIKALIIQGSNPMLIWPNTNRAENALRSLELLVVIDLFMTDTARLADVVLPCTSFLEEKSFKNYKSFGLPLVTIGEQAIKPIGNSMEDWKIVAELGKRLGFEKYFPWKNADELFLELLKFSGITIDQLKEKPGGVFYAKPEPQKYLKEGFGTPSGKIELFSETMDKYGYAPLPTFEDSLEDLMKKNNLTQDCPFILITGSKTKYFTHSRFRNIPSLRRHCPKVMAEINTKAGEGLGIKQGDTICLRTPKGSIKVNALLTDDIHPEVISLPHGWREANANLLIDDSIRDPISSYPGFKAIPCSIETVPQSNKP